MASTPNTSDLLRRNGVQNGRRGSRYSTSSRFTGSMATDGSGDSVSIRSGMELITYVFPDFKAVEYFEKEFVTYDEFHISEVTTASGFEIYLIDQWIRSRKIGSFISVYTGNHQSKVHVVKFTVIKKAAEQYPPRFQEYLNELVLNHATFKKMTPQATDSAGLSSGPGVEVQLNEYLLVTNLTAFPHNLNLIAVTSGDSRPAIKTYMINSNLRMFHCGGRSLSLLAEKVSDSCASRFRQMYRINNEDVPVEFAILEIVNIIQICLFYFDLLDAKYADGLLCQKTEDAIQNWWNLIGLPIFNMKPDSKSGILSSKTVSAIISLTVSVKLRLQMFGGCDVPKDPFDFENFMLSIGQCQKQIGLDKKRKLDLTTLLRIFYYTNTDEQAKQMYSGFGGEAIFKDYQDLPLGGLAISPTSNANLSSISVPGASMYRRNRIHYSKELKKLTNVVRNSVQDRIISKGDDDDVLANSLTNKSKIRSKIASKLTDNLTPADVETLDIDVFVKKCLIGKTLVRLWIGWHNTKGTSAKHKEGAEASSSAPAFHSHHNNFSSGYLNLKSHLLNYHGKSGDFHFVSFRDSIYALTQNNEALRKQGKRRFGFPYKQTQSKMSFNDSPFEESYGSAELPESVVDSDPTKGVSHKPSVLIENCPNFNSARLVSAFNGDCFHVLNRRNSFPFMSSGHELGLNSIEYIKNKEFSVRQCAKRRASFSSLEGTLASRNELHNPERVRISYVNQTLATITMDSTLVDAANLVSQRLGKQFEKTNHELVRLHNICYHIEQRKKSIEGDYYRVLEGKMNDLVENIDRMSFRTRDLTKKITELEVNAKTFEHKVKKGALDKLDSMINSVVNTPKFKKVFKDEEEMKKMYKLISGKDYDFVQHDQTKDFWRLQIFVVYLYEFLITILQFFKFDRSKMNLDRIREQYKKIDPTREYINHLYNLIGAKSHSESEPQMSEQTADETSNGSHKN